MIKSEEAKTQLLRSIVRIAKELPPSALAGLISALDADDSRSLDRFAVTTPMKEKLNQLEQLLALVPNIDGRATALALLAAAETHVMTNAENGIEIAWTGPSTKAVPMRRVDQVTYEMVESAKKEILLVTYAAYKAEKALKALRDATNRGVKIRFIIELAKESGGKISFDGLEAIREAIPAAHIFYWPLNRRKSDSSGSYGSMHAKCMVVDRAKAIVSSANLTDYALNANMELGLVIGSSKAKRIVEHFDQLILQGELALAPTAEDMGL